MKIAFNDFTKIFSALPQGCCHEVLFSVEGCDKYQHSWLGETNTNGNPTFWFGLTSEGSEAYDYNNFDEMANAPIFEGKSLKEIWDKVDIIEFDALEPEYIIPKYLN